MDLEHLNKSQIIMLTLLVSFMTSIATGIVTVSLMEQAPPTIAQTVNRVVERTVERVVPSGQEASAATPIVTEKTIIVNQSDLIASAVQKVSPSIVRLFTTGKDAEGIDVDVFLGFGLVLSDSGVLVTDVATLPSGAVRVELSHGESVTAAVQSRDEVSGLAFLQAATSSGEMTVAWRPAALAQGSPSLGEVAVGISGRATTRIGDGIVTSLPDPASPESSRFVETNIPVGAIAFGSALVNVDGEVIGISTGISRALSENTFLASESIIMYTSAKEPEDAGDSPQ